MLFSPDAKIYTVHMNTDASEPYETAEFVEEGFNWWAFIFVAFWAFYKRLWVVGLALLAIQATLSYAAYEQWLNPASIMAIQLGVRVTIGFLASDLVRGNFKQRGYITADIVSGESRIRAEQRFFERYLAKNPGLQAHA